MPFVFGLDLFHFIPKNWRMISDLCMGEFVHDHVVNHLQWCQHQSPGETERAIGTARAPARAGRRDANFPIDEIILFCMKSNPLRDYRHGLCLVPKDEGLSGFRKIGICQKELVAAECESGSLMRNDGQWIFCSQIKKSFASTIILLQWGRASLRLDFFLMDPLRMELDEFLDMNSRHPERSEYGQGSIALDDECNCLSSGLDKMVYGDGHDQ